MELDCSQILVNVSNLDEARAFYVDLLEFPLIESFPRMFAFRAGAVRVSVFGGGRKRDPADEEDGSSLTLMFRTPDLDAAVKALGAKGVAFDGEVQEAPGFMKHVALLDPDGNTVYLAQYHRDPLKPEKS